MKSGRRTAALAAFAMVTMVGLTSAPAGAAEEPFVFQSSNELNRAVGAPHVELLSAEPGNVTLRFATTMDVHALIEYRVDGVKVGLGAHFVIDDILYDYVCVETSNQWCNDLFSSVEKSFPAESVVEVRLAAVSDPELSFDWTAFKVQTQGDHDGGAEPQLTKDDCRRGGWEDLKFSNQGHCVRFVMTSKDRR
jgi:hypothetical protein